MIITARDRLTAKQSRAIVALLEHDTSAAAARACGVSEVSIHRWFKQALFRRAYDDAHRRLTEATIDKLATHRAAQLTGR